MTMRLGVYGRRRDEASVELYEERLLTMQREFDEISASNHTLQQQHTSMRSKMYVMSVRLDGRTESYVFSLGSVAVDCLLTCTAST